MSSNQKQLSTLLFRICFTEVSKDPGIGVIVITGGKVKREEGVEYNIIMI
jgi:hypothetical protein